MENKREAIIKKKKKTQKIKFHILKEKPANQYIYKAKKHHKQEA